ncbi:hypothetical protein AOXY_G16270 [Acipenser oxyrinchus oxyrinchus]|uniref:Uncharacterized protein n=1 Tax=Acipenser oxyrinchus oxyrinchus TaxID=40147 RepID=A0AAD8D6S0_ACIOX|nr:hypothetical protein AOXY_G16270 [Acipenser oxyrinchus oxyrinchus]
MSWDCFLGGCQSVDWLCIINNEHYPLHTCTLDPEGHKASWTAFLPNKIGVIAKPCGSYSEQEGVQQQIGKVRNG